MSSRRAWQLLVLALCCAPLFVGLGRADLGGDEAIYSFGVDRILESGDWLAPKSSPHEDIAFLEKPPLKFWIVAAPIRLGLLPHNEFGLRFWDALFGALSFMYVFAIGCRLAGGVAGAVAVLTLFVHGPLLFDHGLRSNNMEAALLLCYCGGIYHFLAWSAAERVSRARLHALGVGLFFALGFMTKFVAAIFLPLVLGSAGLLVSDLRSKALRDWRLWMGVAFAVTALCAPWFVYAYHRFGPALWDVMLTTHVYERFTASLDPDHIRPWHFYVMTMYRSLASSGASLIVGAGLVALVVQTCRGRLHTEGVVVLLWLALPLFLISFGTSKLYHYAYPYLPPLALAAGYAAGLIVTAAPAPLERILEQLYSSGASRRMHPVARAIFLGVAAVAMAVAIASLVYGPVRLELPAGLTFKSSGLLRPLIIAIAFGVLAGASGMTVRVVTPLLVASMLPLPAYRETLDRLTWETRVMSAASDCLRRVEANVGGTPLPGLYLDVPDASIGHAMYYYFRRLRPWTRPEKPSPDRIGAYLEGGAGQKPVLVLQSTYRTFRYGIDGDGASAPGPAKSPPMLTLPDDVLLLLPGPYTACAGDTASLRK